MTDSADPTTGAVQSTPTPTPRKPYHTPHVEDYGAVYELTRSGDDNGAE